MRIVLRAFVVVFFAIVGAVLLALTSTMTSVFTLAATTVLIMGGTGHPLSTPPDDVAGFVQPYLQMAVGNWVQPASNPAPPQQPPHPTGIPGQPYNAVAVITPEQFRFDTGLTDLTYDQSVAEGRANLDGCIHGSSCEFNPGVGSQAPAAGDTFVVFGYSQSATIATLEKTDLAAAFAAGDPTAPEPGQLSFVLIGNPDRPNGGFLARGPQGLTIPIVGATFFGPTPTDTPYATVDIARQYDGWADGPENPLDVLADANAIAGGVYLHGDYSSVDLSDAVLQDRYGDTTYYLVPTPILPILMPLEQIPTVGPVLADTLDPTLRVLVEAGYNRTISPGQPTTWNLLYFPNPIKLGTDLLVSIPTGLDNGISDIAGNPNFRPLGTVRPGPYGVGGPPVTIDPTNQRQSGPTLPVLFGSPTGLVALVDPTTLATDLGKFGRLTSVLNGGLPVSNPSLSTPAGPSLPNPTTSDIGAAAGESFSGLSKDAPAGVSSTSPTPLSDANTIDNRPKNSDMTVASGSAATIHNLAPDPKPDATPSHGQPVSGPSAGTGTNTSATNPSQPLVRLPIGASPSSSTTTRPAGDGPVSKVLNGLTGGPMANASRRTSSH